MTAATGKEALSVVDEKEVDVIFTKLTLPDMSGFEVLSHAKKRLPHSQVRIECDNNSKDAAGNRHRKAARRNPGKRSPGGIILSAFAGSYLSVTVRCLVVHITSGLVRPYAYGQEMA